MIYPSFVNFSLSLYLCCINLNFRSPQDESYSPAQPKRVFNENYVRFQETPPEELCALSPALVAHILPISIQSTRKQQLLRCLRRALVMRTTCTCATPPAHLATRKVSEHHTYVCTYSIAHLGHCRNAHGRLRA